MFNQIIVCEGTHDEHKILAVYKNARCVITNGSEISEDTLLLIKELSKKYEIVIFTDPDSPGEKIRKRIVEMVPQAKHAFIKKEKCISSNNKKVGVEHATKEDIKEALENLLSPREGVKLLSLSDLYELGLSGTGESAKLRQTLSKRLNIGNPNTKTFIKRIAMLGIEKEELKALVGEICE